MIIATPPITAMATTTQRLLPEIDTLGVSATSVCPDIGLPPLRAQAAHGSMSAVRGSHHTGRDRRSLTMSGPDRARHPRSARARLGSAGTRLDGFVNRRVDAEDVLEARD